MTQAGTEKDAATKGRPGGRLLAEWVSLVASALLILGLAGFLLYEAVQPDDPYIGAQVRPLLDQTRQEDGRYILPVEIRNPGQRTFRDLKVEVEYVSPEGKPETQDATLDYLGEGSRQRVYFYFDEDPRGLKAKAEARVYRVE
jgi:uncharacterized protein (TIGR02588 family)